MKRWIGLMVLFAMLFGVGGVSFGAFNGEVKKRRATGWEKEGLQGNVKSIEVLEKRPLIKFKTEKEFYRNGIMKKEVVIINDEHEGSAIFYDEFGNRTREKLNEGATEFRYEPEKVLVFIDSKMRGEGKMTSARLPIEILFYDEKKQMEKIEKYDMKGQLIERTTNFGMVTHFEYNKNGQWTMMKIVASNGDTTENKFIYDEKGNLQTRQIFLMGLERYRYLKFDSKGNWIEGEILSKNGNKLATLTRKIEYFE